LPEDLSDERFCNKYQTLVPMTEGKQEGSYDRWIIHLFKSMSALAITVRH